MKPIIKEKKGYSYDGITYDSKEEIYFAWWLDDMKNAGYILSYYYHSDNYRLSDPLNYEHDKKLKTKTKTTTGNLLRAHFYEPDFKILWDEKAIDIFYGFRVSKKKHPFFMFAKDYNVSVVDVKGKFEKESSKKQVFSINQKWTLQKYKVYVQKIIPEKLFLSTFYPSRYNLTDVSMKPRKGSEGFLSLNQYVTMQIAKDCGL